MKKLFQF